MLWFSLYDSLCVCEIRETISVSSVPGRSEPAVTWSSTAGYTPERNRCSMSFTTHTYTRRFVYTKACVSSQTNFYLKIPSNLTEQLYCSRLCYYSFQLRPVSLSQVWGVWLYLSTESLSELAHAKAQCWEHLPVPLWDLRSPLWKER